MKKRFAQTIFLFSFSILGAQDIFEHPYKFSDDILLHDTMLQHAAWSLSYIGEYRKALEVWDREEPKWPNTIDQIQNEGFLKYGPVDARNYKSKNDKTALSLKKGKYKLIIRDKNGQEQKMIAVQ